MARAQRSKRLVVTYWMNNPAAWCAAFGENMPDQQAHGISVVKLRWKSHPRRNATHQYWVKMTAKVLDKEKALAFMKQLYLRRLAGEVGIDLNSITNVWYE